MGRQTLIISGGSGLLGSNLGCYLKESFNIVLLLNKRIIHIDGCQTYVLDRVDEASISSVCKKFKPSYFINSIGLTSVEECESNPEIAELIHVNLTEIISKVCFINGIKLVHISTDHLFDGDESFYDECSNVKPLNQYALTKFQGDLTAINSCQDALVIRTNFFGWGTGYRKSFSDFIVESLEAGKTIALFEDVFFTPVSIMTLSDAITKLLKNNAQGIFNISSNERISKYQFGLMIAEEFNLDVNLIKACSIKDRKNLVKRPLDMSLSNTKFTKSFGELDPLRKQVSDLNSSRFIGANFNVHNGFIPYGKHYLDEKDIEVVSLSLRGDFLTQGPLVSKFEQSFTNVVGAKYSISVSNGTAALHLACVALGLSSGDWVITTPLSFVATANAILYAGATPVFADIDPNTLNISVESVREKLRDNRTVKAIIVVNFAGAPGPMQELRELADEYGVKIIEDASHALGASYANDEKVGSGAFAEAATFSLHPVKGVTAGEGGVVTTNDRSIYHRLLKLRSHGITKGNFAFLGISHPSGDLVDQESAIENGELRPWYYEMQELGFNYRLTDFQSALATSQLGKLNRYLAKKRQLVSLYDEAFRDIENINATQLALRSFSAHHIYVTEVDFDAIGTTRHRFMKAMMAAGVGTQVHYIPIVSQPFYRQKGFRLDDYPNTKAFYAKALTLPLYFQITPWQQEQVIDVVKGLVHVPA